jgi:hypothetical protein
LEHIVYYFIHRDSSGFVEGLNNKIKVIKRRCYGILNAEHLFHRIFWIFQGAVYLLYNQSVADHANYQRATQNGTSPEYDQTLAPCHQNSLSTDKQRSPNNGVRFFFDGCNMQYRKSWPHFSNYSISLLSSAQYKVLVDDRNMWLDRFDPAQ